MGITHATHACACTKHIHTNRKHTHMHTYMRIHTHTRKHTYTQARTNCTQWPTKKRLFCLQRTPNGSPFICRCPSRPAADVPRPLPPSPPHAVGIQPALPHAAAPRPRRRRPAARPLRLPPPAVRPPPAARGRQSAGALDGVGGAVGAAVLAVSHGAAQARPTG